MSAPPLRMAYVGSTDLEALLHGSAPDAALHEDFDAILSDSAAVELAPIPPGGWASTLDALRSDPSLDADRINVLLTSASAELADPSEDPRGALTGLSEFVQHHQGHLIVLNASTLSDKREAGGDGGSGTAERLDLRIRRLNLEIMEVSNAVGLSVLDADRLVAETRLPAKVLGPFGYVPEIQGLLRSALASILGSLGFAERAAMEARMPYVRGVANVSVERWVKSEGEPVAAGEVMCQLRLSGLRKLQRPKTATMLASIHHQTPRLERFLARERVQERRLEAVVSLVAGEDAVLRKVIGPAGTELQSGDVLAILSGDGDAPIGDVHAKASPFRAVIQTENPRLEAFL